MTSVGPWYRMLALRMQQQSDGAPAHPAAETNARQLELCLQRTVVGAVLRHTDCEPGTSCADVTLQLLPPGKMERALRRLTEDGYVEGPAPGGEILVRDGQRFGVRFRGNIRCDDGRTVSRTVVAQSGDVLTTPLRPCNIQTFSFTSVWPPNVAFWFTAK